MKSLKCIFGLHDWDGCTCSKCGKQRDEGHILDESRVADGGFAGCVCIKCGKRIHNFEVIDEHDEYPTCPNSGTECWGPCGLCDPQEVGRHVTVKRCRTCGYETSDYENLW